jgi:predicted O-methyltransferase YrrM
MSLKNLVDNSRSDKNTIHSYLDLYEKLLVSKKNTATHILEIGVLAGGSIKLWKDYFPSAIVYGLDVVDKTENWDGVKDEKIKLLIGENAYNQNYVNKHFINNNLKFDVILDDAPHTLQSQKDCIKYYLPLLKDDGILIIEDVQDIKWFNELTLATPDKYKNLISLYDRRHLKDRYDDLVFVINKNPNNIL